MGSDEKKDASVFDVLYSDTRRLSSLLSQFSSDGLVTELKREAGTETDVNVGVDAHILKGGGARKGHVGSSRTFDPQWLLPLLFLDEAQRLIDRDITKAAIGSLVLITGRMVVIDLQFLQGLWSVPSARKTVIAEVKKAKRKAAPATERPADRAARREQDQSAISEAELTLELLPLLPHSPQVNIIASDVTAWATIEPDYFVGTVANLVLKHGAKLPGAWSMVGVLDARPWETRDDGDYDDLLSVSDQARIGMLGDNLWKVAADLALPTRMALGRPLLSYGVTPLIIFRELEQPSAEPPSRTAA